MEKLPDYKNNRLKYKEKLRKLLNKFETQEQKHRDLYKRGFLIPTPFYFRKLLDSGKELDPKLESFISSNMEKIRNDDWIRSKTYTYDYIAEIERLHLYVNADEVKNFEDQLNRERELIENSKLSKYTDKDAIDALESMGSKNIRNHLISNVHNPFTLQAFRCVINTLLDSPDDDEQIARIKIHSFLGNMNKVGQHSSYGIALRAGVGNYNMYSREKIGNVIVKAPNSPLNSHELIHEAAIGHFLNSLRKDCVNFSAVYDAYTGGAPIISSGGEVLHHFSEGGNKVTYAIYEIVNEAIPISSELDRNSLLLHIIHASLALKYANDVYNFTHYDAHDGNILLYKYSDSEFYIHHKFGNRDLYVKSNGRFPMFIDYGMSCIIKKNEDGTFTNYGILDSTGYIQSKGHFSDMSNPVSDVFKMVMMIIRKIKMNIDELEMDYNKNSEKLRKMIQCRDLCFRVAGYFFGLKHIEIENDNVAIEQIPQDEKFGIELDDFKSIHNIMWKRRYYLRPEIANYFGWNISDFISYCVDISFATIHKGVLLDEPENVLGKNFSRNVSETNSQQIDKQLHKMGVNELEVVSAETLFISRFQEDNEELKQIFLSNITESLEIDRRRISNLMDYKWSGHIFIIPDNISIMNKSQCAVIEENFDNVSKFIDTYVKIADQLSILEHARNLSINEDTGFSPYDELFYSLNNKKNKLEPLMEKLKKAMDRSIVNLNLALFETKKPSEGLIMDKRGDDKYEDSMCLYDKCMNIMGALNSL